MSFDKSARNRSARSGRRQHAKVFFAALGVIGLGSSAKAATYYFDPNGTFAAGPGTYSWDSVTTDWSLSAGGGAQTTFVQGSDAFFSAPTTGVNSTPGAVGAVVVGSQFANSLQFMVGTTTVLGTASGATLSIGSGGIIVSINQTNFGVTTLDASLGTVTLATNQTWSGANIRQLVSNAAITPAANLGPVTLNLSPSGSPVYNQGGFVFSAPLTDGVNSPLTLLKIGNGNTFFYGSNNYTGGTTVEGGGLIYGNASSATPNASIGNGSVVLDAGIIGFSATSDYKSANYNGNGGFLIGPRAGIFLLNPGTTFINASGGPIVPLDPTSSGFVAVALGSSNPLTTRINQSLFGNGAMFFTGLSTTGGGVQGISTAQSPGVNNIYRFGAGGPAGTSGVNFIGSNYLTNTGTGATPSSSTSLVIGEPLANVGGTLGTGIVSLNVNTTTSGTTGTSATNTFTQNYAGTTTVDQGSRVDAQALTSGTGSPFGTGGTINLNGGGLQIDQFSFKNSISNVTYNAVGTININSLNFTGNSALTINNVASSTSVTTLNISNSPVNGTRQENGVLQIAVAGTGNTLGGYSHILFGTAPTPVNGILPVYIQDNSGNFLSYDTTNNPSTGVIPDVTTATFPTAGGAATAANGNVKTTAAAVITGAGTGESVNSLVLGGNLTATGGNTTVSIASGGLSFTAGSTVGSTTAGTNVDLAFGGAEAVVSGNSTATITNTISNAAGLTKGGTNTITLLGTNTFVGNVSVEGGTLTVNGDAALGAGGNNVFINGGALAFTTNNVATGRTITFGNGVGSVSNASYTNTGAALNAGGHTVALSGTLTTGGAGTSASFVDFSNGTFIVASSSANDFTAPVFVEGGAILSFSNDNQLGNASNLLYLNGAFTLSAPTATPPNAIGSTFAGLQGIGTLAHNVALNGSGGVFDVPAGSLTVTSTISGGAPLVKSDLGTLVLAQASTSTYSSTTTISGGILQIGNGGTSGQLGVATITNNAALAFNRSDAVTISNAINGTGNFSMLGPGSLNLTASNNYSGGTTVVGGTLFVRNTAGSGTGGGAVAVNGGTFGGTGTASGAINVSGGGTLEAGIGNASANLTTGAVTFAGGAFNVTLNSGGSIPTTDTLTSTGPVALGAGLTLLSATDLSTNTTSSTTPIIVIAAASTPTGYFAGLPDTTLFQIGNNIYEINYGTAGAAYTDDVTFTPEPGASVPEPTCIAAVSMGGLAMLRRRRRR